MRPRIEFHVGDALESLRRLPDRSVHVCVTSPPYYGLRDYGTGTWYGGDPDCKHVVGQMRRGLGLAESPATTRGGAVKIAETPDIQARSECPHCGAVRKDQQIGLEETPDQYVERLVSVFQEVRRVMRDDGTLWLNIGDSYAAGGNGGGSGKQLTNVGSLLPAKRPPEGCKAKDLLGIPWMLAFALRADGWYLRQDIIWHKPNPMPESVRDRCTKAHEYLFVLAKSERYFWDIFAMQEDGVFPAGTKAAKGSASRQAIEGVNARPPEYKVYNGKRNRRSVWSIATKPFRGAHFATFPPALIEPCIQAGSSEHGACRSCGSPWLRETGRPGSAPAVEGSALDRFGTGDFGVHRKVGGQYQKYLDVNPVQTLGWRPGCACADSTPIPCVVLDPFAGSGTTGSVAKNLGRSAVLCELNTAYVDLAHNRIALETEPPGSLPHELARRSFASARLAAALDRVR